MNQCNPPTRFGVHSLLFLCSIQNFVTRCPSKIPSPKSKIQDAQNPKSPKSKIPKFQNPNFAHKDLLHNVPKIPNPKSPKSRKSKIQNPQNPKSKIPEIQNPKSPKSKIPKIPKIQNPQNPKSKIPKIQNPSFFGRNFGDLGILDLGFRPQNPKSKLPKIQNPKSPKSKIPKIQNPQNPKSSAEIQNLGRWGPHVKNCFLMMQNPKSKIPKIRPKKLGFWILGILDFGDFGFWDFGDFGFWGFWILRFWGFWILGILDFGFWDFGFWILGFWGFWILGILDFGILGRSRGCTTRQFGDGAWRSEARIPPGLPLGATSKPTVSNRFFQRSEPYKITEKPWLPTKRSELYKITEKPRLPTHFKTNLDEPSDHTPENRRKLKK